MRGKGALSKITKKMEFSTRFYWNSGRFSTHFPTHTSTTLADNFVYNTTHTYVHNIHSDTHKNI